MFAVKLLIDKLKMLIFINGHKFSENSFRTIIPKPLINTIFLYVMK